ncbi:MAG: HutD family protein [Asticcacaulis sp.]
MITRLLAADRIVVPWKNGGGVTREVAVSPPGAGMADFDWRVSTAEVTQAGPFSRFDGIDRHLTVLRGKLRLDFSDHSVTLGPLDSLAFSGSEAVAGVPLEPVLDLNVMSRRGKTTATVRQVEGDVQMTSRVALLIDLQSLDAIHIEDETRLAGVAPSLLIELG